MSCDQCGKTAADASVKALSQCARCKSSQYCSQACQRAAWPKHKLVCGKGGASSSAAAAALAAAAAATPGRPGGAAATAVAARKAAQEADDKEADTIDLQGCVSAHVEHIHAVAGTPRAEAIALLKQADGDLVDAMLAAAPGVRDHPAAYHQTGEFPAF